MTNRRLWAPQMADSLDLRQTVPSEPQRLQARVRLQVLNFSKPLIKELFLLAAEVLAGDFG